MTDSRYDRRPILQIDVTGGAGLGRCYSSTTFSIRSNRKLETRTIQDLRAAGFLGYGQEWRCSGPVEEPMRYVPEGKDWRGQPYGEICLPVYVYTVTDLCDSSD